MYKSFLEKGPSAIDIEIRSLGENSDGDGDGDGDILYLQDISKISKKEIFMHTRNIRQNNFC